MDRRKSVSVQRRQGKESKVKNGREIEASQIYLTRGVKLQVKGLEYVTTSNTYFREKS